LDVANGGATVTRYDLEVNAGGKTNDVYTVLASYDGTAALQTHTLDSTTDSLTFGTIYKLRFRAVNVEGAGDYSDTVLVALSALPTTPTALTRVEADCTETSIAVSWAAVVPAPEFPGNAISGYRLYAARDQSNIYTMIYDGVGYPQITTYIYASLVTGSQYDFKVSAYNFNGEGAMSTTPLTTYSCLAPSGLTPPARVAASSTASTVALSWVAPTSLGGCPLTGYAVYRNDPDQSDLATGTEVFVEVNSAMDTNIRDKPDLFSATVTNFAAASTGKEFKYTLEAINAIGGTTSRTVSYVLATVPSTPSSAPTIIESLTSSTQITILVAELTGDAATGGDTITSYGLQMSQNSADEAAVFVELNGITTDSLAIQYTATGVTKGKSYSFRYKAKNQYGWGADWSAPVYGIAADPPAAPPSPTLTAATDTSVAIALYLPLEDGGQSFTSLELERDAGDQAVTPTWTTVTTYTTTSFALTHTMTVALDGLVLG
jgi:hypothetical protein